MNVYDCAHALAGALKKSPEHRNYQSTLERLNRETSARDMLNDLRHLQLKIQSLRMQDQEITSEDEEKLTKLSEIVSLNLTAKAYLEAEYRLAVLMNDIQKIIGEPLDELMKEQMPANEDTGDAGKDE